MFKSLHLHRVVRLPSIYFHMALSYSQYAITTLACCRVNDFAFLGWSKRFQRSKSHQESSRLSAAGLYLPAKKNAPHLALVFFFKKVLSLCPYHWLLQTVAFGPSGPLITQSLSWCIPLYLISLCTIFSNLMEVLHIWLYDLILRFIVTFSHFTDIIIIIGLEQL